MPAKAAVVLAIPLVFAAPVALADTSNQTGYRPPFVAEAVPKAPADRIGDPGNYARSGFALFRRGRLIQGSGEDGYRPPKGATSGGCHDDVVSVVHGFVAARSRVHGGFPDGHLHA